MNYQKIYDDICLRGQTRILENGVYFERHHIIPKCLGGSNDKSNISKLTAREHFLVHYILAFKLYTGNRKLIYAIRCMCSYFRKSHMKYIPSCRTYEYIKRLDSEIRKTNILTIEQKKRISEANKGRPSSFKGRKHTEETKKKLSLINKGRESIFKGRKHTEETKKKISQNQIGRILSAEHKKKISDSNKGKHNHKVTISDETKKKMSIAKLGVKKSDETKKKMSIANVGEKNPNFGKKMSECQKQKMKAGRIAKSLNIIYDKNTN